MRKRTDGSPTGSLVRQPVLAAGRNDDADNDLAHGHADRSRDHHGLAAQLVDVEDGRHGGDAVEDADDAGREQRRRAAGQAERLEDGRGVVQDRVDAGPLLEELWCAWVSVAMFGKGRAGARGKGLLADSP